VITGISKYSDNVLAEEGKEGFVNPLEVFTAVILYRWE